MSQNIEKAFEISNLMATVANQKRILKEEYEQSLFYFENGGTFRADTTTITYVKTLKELIKESRLVVVDFNSFPIENLMYPTSLVRSFKEISIRPPSKTFLDVNSS